MIFTLILVIILLFFGILLFDARSPGTIPSPAIGDLGMPLFTFLRYSISSPFIDDESEVEDAGFMEKMFGSLRLDIAKAEHKKREEEEEEEEEQEEEEATPAEEATPTGEAIGNSSEEAETYIKNPNALPIGARIFSPLFYKI